jgi:hypothetical protein
MTVAKKIVSLLSVLTLLSACGTLYGTPEDDIPTYSEPRYNTDTPIELKVNKIEVISEFTPSFTRPHVEHLFPVSIEKTAKLWAQDRLKAADFSSSKIARVTIHDASVTEDLEEGSQLFERDKVKYAARLVVSVKIIDSESMAQATTEVEAWRSLTLPADTDIATKEGYWNGMVKKLFDDFNDRMTANIHNYLNAFVAGQSVSPTYY